MNDSEKLDTAKKEIRSILISFQKGCSLSEFNRSYRDFIGQRLPYKELGFISDLEFLRSMPDVVKISHGNGDYHLWGIADEKSQHIQKLVCKQKSSKIKPSARRVDYPRKYVAPPRFHSANLSLQNRTLPKPLPKSMPKSEKEDVISFVKEFPDGIDLNEFLPLFEEMYYRTFIYKNYGFLSLIDCLESIPELKILKTKHHTIVYYANRENITSKQKAVSPACNENLMPSQDCLINQNTYKRHENTWRTEQESNQACPNTLDAVEDDVKNSASNQSSMPATMKVKLKKLAQKFPQGIWAAEFPSHYEEISGMPFDLHSLGYNYLADFIDDHPDIFIRKRVFGSKKDWIIYPLDAFDSDMKGIIPDADTSLPKGGALVVEYIILNIRKILEGYSEGIKLKEFFHIYSINCNDAIYFNDLGFDNVENFLLSIANRVPLRIESKEGYKIVHLVKSADPVEKRVAECMEMYNRETLPEDAASPDSPYTALRLPDNFDFSKYVPVYTSSIAHPGLLYVQLQGKETTYALGKLADELESVYSGPHGNRYIMKNVHIKVGASCVALWPCDQHWYRAKILSIPSMEFVQVFYVDYGTREEVPKSMLRYIKKEHMKLPTQALKSRLALLRPPLQAQRWDIKTKNRLLSMCQDISLMAKIKDVNNGVLSLILCDTNGEEDIYINDVLLKEGLAESIDNPDGNWKELNKSFQDMVSENSLNPLLALQAQYFLQSCAAASPSVAGNDDLVKLLSSLSLKSSIGTSPQQAFSPPVNSITGAGVANLLPCPPLTTLQAANLLARTGVLPEPVATNSLTASTSTNSFLNNMLGNASSFVNLSPTDSNINSATYMPKASSPCMQNFESALTSSNFISGHDNKQSPRNPASIFDGDFEEHENDIFEDDDEMFQQFCLKVSTMKKRFVKRLSFEDGCKIHIIVFKSEPYVSGGDLSVLIWPTKPADYLFRRLQVKEENFETVNVSEDGNEELFHQMERYSVKGLQKTVGLKSSIVLYPLKFVIKILNTFGHPSLCIREKLIEENVDFDLSDAVWQEFSEADEIENDEGISFDGMTDDDKINRLCLYDLLAMKEGIRCRRLKLMNNLQGLETHARVDEIEKLENLQMKVLERIREIREICDAYS